MIVGGQFGVELSGFDIVFSEAIFANKIVISQLINGLDGLRVKELTVGHKIQVLLILKNGPSFGIKLFLEVLVIGVRTAELVVVDIGVADD
jgi:hypothetical protein